MNDRGREESFVDFLSKKIHQELESSPTGYSTKNVLFKLIMPEECETNFLAISGLWRIEVLSESPEEHQRALCWTNSSPTQAAHCKNLPLPAQKGHSCLKPSLSKQERETATLSPTEGACFHPAVSLMHISALLTNSRNILFPRTWSYFNI